MIDSMPRPLALSTRTWCPPAGRLVPCARFAIATASPAVQWSVDQSRRGRYTPAHAMPPCGEGPRAAYAFGVPAQATPPKAPTAIDQGVCDGQYQLGQEGNAQDDTAHGNQQGAAFA